MWNQGMFLLLFLHINIDFHALHRLRHCNVVPEMFGSAISTPDLAAKHEGAKQPIIQLRAWHYVCQLVNNTGTTTLPGTARDLGAETMKAAVLPRFVLCCWDDAFCHSETCNLAPVNDFMLALHNVMYSFHTPTCVTRKGERCEYSKTLGQLSE